MLILFILFISSNVLHAQPFIEVDELAEAFVRSLKKRETSEFKKLLETDSSMIEYIDKKLGFDYRDSLISDFTNIVKEGIEKGINWDKINFIKAEYITTTDGPFLVAQPCYVIFQHRLFRYSIQMNASRIKNKWSFVPIKRENEIIKLRKI
jgi:hypothetical protein